MEGRQYKRDVFLIFQGTSCLESSGHSTLQWYLYVPDSFISWIGEFIANERATGDKRDRTYNSFPAYKLTNKNYPWLFGTFSAFLAREGFMVNILAESTLIDPHPVASLGVLSTFAYVELFCSHEPSQIVEKRQNTTTFDSGPLKVSLTLLPWPELLPLLLFSSWEPPSGGEPGSLAGKSI